MVLSFDPLQEVTMNKLLVGTIALVTVFSTAASAASIGRGPRPPQVRGHSRRVKEYGSEPRANSVYRRPLARTGTLLTKSTIRVQIIVSGKGRRLRSAPFLL